MVVVDGVLEAAEPELVSVLPVVPVLPVVEPAVPEAPIEVPEPVEPVEPEVDPMLEPVPVVEPGVAAVVLLLLPVPPLLLLVSVDGVVVLDGAVVLEVEELVPPAPAAESSFLPQADRDKAAIRARAAHCAMGDLIIRNSLRFRIEWGPREWQRVFPLPAAHFSDRAVRSCRLPLSKVVGQDLAHKG